MYNNLKLFNEFYSEPLYKRVNVHYGYVPTLDGEPFNNFKVNLSGGQIKRIENVIMELEIGYTMNIYSHKSEYNYLVFMFKNFSVDITLLEEDWYIVECGIGDWKCDGLEGLKILLEFLINNYN